MSPQGTGAASQRRSTPPVAALAITLLVVMLVTPGITRLVSRWWWWWRTRDDATRAHVAWGELRDDLADHRMACPASESPRALARRMADVLGLGGDERAALQRIAYAEERASYALSPADSARLRADTALVRRAVARASGLPARWSARIAPLSALALLRTGPHHVLNVFGRMEQAATRTFHRPPSGLRNRLTSSSWQGF